MRVLPLLTLVLVLSALSVPAANAAATTVAETDGLLTGPRQGDAEQVAWRWLTDHKQDFKLDADDLENLKLTTRSRARDGVTHLEWTQTVRGVEGLNASVRINVTRDGQVVNAGGSPIPDLSLQTARPALSAGTALRIAQRNARVPAGRPSPVDDAKLVAIADPGSDRLAWRITVAGHPPLVYSTVIDAATGKVLTRHLLTDFASTASVFENHPGAAVGGTATTQDITPYLTGPTPTTLTGPNAHAYADLIDDDVATAGEDIGPSSGSNFTYPQTLMGAGSGQSCPTNFGGATTCTWSGINGGTQGTNRSQRTVQLFYFVNKYHDWLRDQVGFTATDRNFETTDPVIAQSDDGDAQDCDHINNANMFTPPDGNSPIMQMYFFATRCGDSLPAVSSSDDASVVYHEYTHGLSNRLIGNGFGLVSNQGGAMGEGWSDWYALDYLVDNGYEPDTPASGQVAEGKYVTNETTHGIRTDPIDCPVGSSVNCNGSTNDPGGGYTYADLGHVSSNPSEVHANGEIWAQTLWDLRIALTPATARARITDGMRLSPTIDPSFLDMRNAIISADVVAGGTNVDAIWTVFGGRGMAAAQEAQAPAQR